MLRRPLFLVAIAFAAGIVLSAVCGLPLAIGLAGLAFGCAWAAARRAYVAALLFATAATGMLRYDAHLLLPPDDVSRFIPAYATGAVGRVASDVDLREDHALFVLAVEAVEVGGRRVTAQGKLMVCCYRPEGVPEWHPPDYGDALILRSRITRPSAASNPGAFSWRNYLARQRIYAITYVRGAGSLRRLGSGRPNPLTALALRAKQGIARSIARAMPADEASVVAGMALGSYSVLPERLQSNFRKTGTLHLLAASGFNCAVIVIVFGFLLRRLGKLPKGTASVVLICVLIFYMLMVGAKPSIVRATVMASLVLLGSVIGRPADSLNLLFAAAIIILAMNPADLFDIGFQLSFAAVLALVLVLPIIQETAKRWRIGLAAARPGADWKAKAAMRVTGEGWQGLTATAAATLGTLPLSAHYFNQLSLVSVVVNAIVAAAVLPIFAIGLLLPLLSWAPGIGPAISFIGMMITRFTLSVINWFGELPYSCLSVPSPGAAGAIGYYALLCVGLMYAYSRIAAEKGTARG